MARFLILLFSASFLLLEMDGWMNGWDGHSGGVLLHFGGLFLRDLLKIEREGERRVRERDRDGKRHGGMAFVGHANACTSYSRSYQRERHRDIECNKSVSSTQ